MQFSDFILIINGFVHVLTPYAVIMNIALVCSITCSTYRHRSFLEKVLVALVIQKGKPLLALESLEL